MKSSFDYQVFIKGTKKNITNSIIAAFPLLLPFPANYSHNIILINYRWDGELILDRGLRLLSN